MKKLYLFNPENDMALASGSPYYMAPASAKKMASDLGTLPAWYTEAGSRVLVTDVRQVEWLQKSMEFSLDVEGVTEVPPEGAELMPWGWSPALLHRMEGRVKPKVDIAAVRTLSSRQTAVELLPLLQMEGTMGESVWLTSVDEVCAFAGQYEKVLLKAPWSGSGKGIQPVCGMPDDNLKGWTRRIIASQGGVVGEPFYNKVKDFAFEFKVSDEGVEPVGYSLFEADARGIYKENRLASDEVIEAELSVYVPKENLQKLWMRLQTELQLLLGEAYRGYLGVYRRRLCYPSVCRSESAHEYGRGVASLLRPLCMPGGVRQVCHRVLSPAGRSSADASGNGGETSLVSSGGEDRKRIFVAYARLRGYELSDICRDIMKNALSLPSQKIQKI